tara:strand:+ start:459 stop:878 length:420 start_codon:yes stop_codon:yes gene_type:complete
MKNRFVRLLEFSNNQLGSQNAYTLNQLMDLQDVHSNWATKQYSIIGILRKHRMPVKEWDKIIEKNNKWYSSPRPEEDIINNEIKAHIKKVVGYIPAQVLWSKSIFSGQLSSLFRKGKNGNIQRFKDDRGHWRYYWDEVS